MSDAHHDRSQALVRRLPRPYLISDWTVAEVASALGRHVRMKTLATSGAEEAIRTLDGWIESSVERLEVQPQDIRATADLLCRFEFSLRTPDALHVAIARRVGASFATFDAALARDARRLDLEVLEA